MYLAPKDSDSCRVTLPPGRRALSGLFFLLAAVLLYMPSPASSLAQSKEPNSSGGDVLRAFRAASALYAVPVEVLLAIGYVESRWEQRPGLPSLDNGYGIMHITERIDGTLARAQALTGLSPREIKELATANIAAGAALLAAISHETGIQESDDPASWYRAVRLYAGAVDDTVRDLYAQQVYETIAAGVSATLSSGEVVVLPATHVEQVARTRGTAPSSDDYPPALWVPAHLNNYTVGRPYPPLDTIVIHDTEGSYASAISWFQNPGSGVSAHYVIRSSDGQVTQMVREADTAYHAGVWDYNVRSIGIEHEGYAGQPGWFTEPMYQSSAALVRSITERRGIKKDRAHIIGHYQVPGQSHTDPGPYWNWTYYMSLVRRDSERSALVDNTDSGFAAVPPQIDPAHYWWVYGGGYNSSSTYATTSVVNQGSSYNSGTWGGWLPATAYYDVYAYVPYVDNSTPDTAAARYVVYAANGTQTAIVSQKAITDQGVGGWVHLGKFYFAGGAQARVSLSDWTGESGRNVWFDAMMWIPATGGSPPPTAVPSATARPNTPTPVPSTAPPASPTATRTPTRVPTRTNTPLPPTPTVTTGPTFTPGLCGINFSDLPNTHWAYSHVVYLYCRQIVSGYPDGTFRPGNSSTRGQFAKMLVLAMSWTPYNPVNPTFSDVQPGSTFYQYVEAAYLHGTINGYPDGTFRPGEPVLRAQATKMLVIARQWPLVTPPTPTFSDVLPSHWAYAYVETAVSKGIVAGYPDGTFGPAGEVTRAQLAKMVALTMQVYEAKGARAETRPSIPPPQPTGVGK